jgi:general stress protein 26
MKRLNNDIISFFREQGFVIVSTLNNNGSIHSSCKGIVAIEQKGSVYLIDLYHGKTFKNLKKDKHITITAVNEHRYIGYALSGLAEIVSKEDISDNIYKLWEKNISKRASKRLIKNVKNEHKTKYHPEVKFPDPKYLISFKIEKIVDLAPNR